MVGSRRAVLLRCAALIGALSVQPAMAYQPTPNMRVINKLLIEQDLQYGVSGGKSQLATGLGLIVSSPRDVAMAYLGNEVSANQKYEGRVVALRGEALSIQAGYGEPFIEFARSGEWGVRAYFIQSETDKLAKLRRLDPVSVVCKGRGVVMGVPIFNGCLMASTWKSAVASDIRRDVSDFYAGRSSTRAATLIGVASAAIAEMVRDDASCSKDEDACSAAMGAFYALTDEQQADRMHQAIERLKKAGLKVA
ncbi:hypothetical protein EUC41_09080 [Achromobacter denitrificans]|uniref:OB-fold protein n=1 Tax=Achromobacter denitrificans TaxID=32002 RepID=UPI00240E4DEC|nr:hypothetical protein [Achromobacter denitrificans]WFC66454.1 hypothetical protein EUC41_09080 [Achromobacter denitrificans]